MDLFAAAGMEIDEGGRTAGRPGRQKAARGLRIPLFNHKVVEEARRLVAFNPSERQLALARDYARKARSPRFAKIKETSVRDQFYDEVMVGLLGYRKIDPDAPYTLHVERAIRQGSADVALGRFQVTGAKDEIVAPVEMKGPGTRDLDAIQPGTHRSPVQQAWDYAIDTPGARWVVVCNCVEMRLYGFGRGRDAYEVFDLSKLDEPEEHARLWLILSAGRFLSGETDALLQKSDGAYKDITNDLYEQYSQLRERLLNFLVNSADGPSLARREAIEVTQKLLDRILFVAFAQRNNLVRDRVLKDAAEERNRFDPTHRVWHNFQHLFRFLDKGHRDQDIPAYNGGLFAHDRVVDTIVLPDWLATDLAKLGEWDYRIDVPVTVLGHIFEQSITDIEKLRAESEGKPAPKVSKRKREGVVYTPDIVTRFLVERTVGLTLSERFNHLLAVHAKSAVPPKNGDPVEWRRGEESERAFWRDYLAALRSMTVVDPACGSGAFLVAALDFLAGEYRRVIARLADLDETVEFDHLDQIVTGNLHGVDVNPESVEITRLSLWLKTARRKHRLQNLDQTVKVGDSLIDDAAFSDRPFDWRAAFPEVFARGGFDVVIGNPPYVRMELIKPIKPYLEKHYAVAADRADLYAYFYERGVGLLKEGGRLGYISSSTFFRTGSGGNLRRFLGDGATIETVVDFGDLQLFEGVTTYPAIVTLKKGAAGDGGQLAFLKVEGSLPKDLVAAFAEKKRAMPRARVGAGSWRFEDEPLARLRDKITAGRKTLGEVYGPPLYGIKTGFNQAFVIDRETRDRLVAADPRSEELLKPFLRGENIKRWHIEPEGLFLINTPKGKVDVDDYPAIRDWLLPFKPELEKRATKQEWFELQQAQSGYQKVFLEGGVTFPDFSQGPKFSLLQPYTLIDCTVFFIKSVGIELVSLMNSRLYWFTLFGLSNPMRGGTWRLRLKAQYIEQVPIAELTNADRTLLVGLGELCTTNAIQRFEIISKVNHRIHDLASVRHAGSITRKLENWWDLDFKGFRSEVKRAFHADIPLKERAEWEAYLAANAAEVKALTGAIAEAEREIDAIVYRLFDFSDEEVRLLEASLEGQY